MKPVRIVEVGPRDGLQSDAAILTTEAKLEFVTRLIGSGVQRIEVTSFVNPRRVPQMADAEELMKAVPRGGAISYIGLVLNEQGFDRAAAAKIDEISFVIITTDSFSRRNQNADTNGSIKVCRRVARRAESCGIQLNISIAAAFGCPFEGPVSYDRVIAIVDTVMSFAPTESEICLADTIGAAVPRQVAELAAQLRERYPTIRLRGHFHNTRNTGIANALAALEHGIEALDSSAGGIGGCPFAPAATGNIATEDLIYVLHRSGFQTGVSLSAAIETSNWLERALDHPIPAMLPKAGVFPSSEFLVNAV